MSENKIEIDLLLAIEKQTAQINQLQKHVQDFGTSANTFFGKATAAWSSFKGNLAAEVVMKSLELITSASKQLFQTFIVDGVEAARQQEDSINRLNVALAQAGQYSRATSEDIQALASSIQSSTQYSDDAVLSASALIESLGQLDSRGLKRATQAAVDLSAALGIDLPSAAQMLGKAANGEITTLNRYGLEIQKGASDAATFENALKALNGQFGGAAAAQVNTFSGALALAKNAFGEIQEAVGGLITKNPVVIQLFKEITVILNKLAGWINENKDSLTALVSEGIIFLVEAVGLTIDAFTLLIKCFENTVPGVKLLAMAFYGEEREALYGALQAAGDGVDNLAEKLQNYSNSHKKMVDTTATNNKALVKSEKDTSLAIKAWNDQTNKERVEGMKSTFGQIATLTASSNETLFTMGKVAAISQATIDGVLAVQKAFASAPPPFSYVLAAAAGVAAAVNVGKIANQQPPKFAEGGIVPGASTFGDQTLIRANAREAVLTMEDQRSLFNAIRTGNMGGGSISVVIQGDVRDESTIDRIIEQIREAQLFRGQPGLAGA